MDPAEPDAVRAAFEAVALDVLRRWAPAVARVAFGDRGVPDTVVRANAARDALERVADADAEVGGECWGWV